MLGVLLKELAFIARVRRRGRDYDVFVSRAASSLTNTGHCLVIWNQTNEAFTKI